MAEAHGNDHGHGHAKKESILGSAAKSLLERMKKGDELAENVAASLTQKKFKFSPLEEIGNLFIHDLKHGRAHQPAPFSTFKIVDESDGKKGSGGKSQDTGAHGPAHH